VEVCPCQGLVGACLARTQDEITLASWVLRTRTKPDGMSEKSLTGRNFLDSL